MSRDEPTAPLGRILVVEDERIVARDLALTLEQLGYQVVGSVATAEDAVAAARREQPDLVLMDVRLAGELDGIDAANAIRRQRDVPIIFLTAHSDDDTLARAKGTDPVGYLVKPYREQDLKCAIEIALHKHQINAQLRERETWLRTTLHSIGEGVITTGPDQRVTFLNPVAEALTGWTSADAIGRELADIVGLVDGPVRDHAAPLVDEQGAVVGGVTVLHDASAEISIRNLNAELERRVVERTEQLERANRELETFNDSIAYDLRAPLRGIEGFSQALIEDHASNLGPAGVAHLQRIRRASARMSRLIDDLLRLSGIARAPLARRTVDVATLALAVADDIRVHYPDRDVALTVGTGLHLDGDEALLYILLEVLLANAWKFTAGAAHAAIEVGGATTESGRAIFVRDTGIGFDAANAPGLFRAFHRFHRSQDFEGTGIGLAIAQRIVERHGGRIWADSRPGEGATFYFGW